METYLTSGQNAQRALASPTGRRTAVDFRRRDRQPNALRAGAAGSCGFVRRGTSSVCCPRSVTSVTGLVSFVFGAILGILHGHKPFILSCFLLKTKQNKNKEQHLSMCCVHCVPVPWAHSSPCQGPRLREPPEERSAANTASGGVRKRLLPRSYFHSYSFVLILFSMSCKKHA